ncbi:hypothetical protein LPU83_pLPU83b_0161 (plasmid) [Rhizobium favelukesii]|uniref:Uncharacterized protein n=1 Tax=Rhizobium favelukesii TaxID=348824 RepID=W6S100_9HYPH|nr:hypothetical protein LPU83_pLPU83b_0161 [Rhizobium favelukesii]
MVRVIISERCARSNRNSARDEPGFRSLACQPSCMSTRPWLATGIDAAVTQQERLNLLARLLQRVAGSLASPHQVADRLMAFIRNPDRRQFTRPVQACQAYGIPAVCLHPVARTLGNQRRCHHHAVVPQFDNLAIKTVAGRAGFITK